MEHNLAPMLIAIPSFPQRLKLSLTEQQKRRAMHGPLEHRSKLTMSEVLLNMLTFADTEDGQTAKRAWQRFEGIECTTAISGTFG